MARCDRDGQMNKSINGHSVFVVESHHHVLSAWARLRANSAHPVHLLTLDSHTDTRDAFLGHCYHSKGKANPQILMSAVDFSDPTSIAHAESLLRHDEHIDCAQRASIIDQAFVFLGAHSGKCTNPRITIFDDTCVPWCPKAPHDDACGRLIADSVIEAAFLQPRLDKVKARLGNPIEQYDYILDIDLDVFLTHQSVNPKDPSLFRHLIKKAKLITIAREPGCVLDLRLADETITADYLLENVERHIEAA